MNRKFLIYNLSAFLLSAIISLVVYWKKLFITVNFKVILTLFIFFIVLSNVSCFISSLISKKWIVDFMVSAVLYVVAFYIFGSFIATAEEGLNVVLAIIGFCANLLFFVILMVVKKFFPANAGVK